MDSFTLSYTTNSPPPGLDGRPQARTVRGRTLLPKRGTPPHPVVVIAHGYTSFMDWGFYPELSRRLAGAGIATLRFNFSGSGVGADLRTVTEPGLFRRNSYLHELDDLELLHKHLHDGHWPEFDTTRTAILGHSRGGAMSLVHASEVADYETVVTWAAIDRILQFSPGRLATWREQGHLDVMNWTAGERLPLDVATLEAAESHAARLDVLAACRRLTCPVLVVMGDVDRSLSLDVARSLVSACPRGELHTVRGGDHTFAARDPLQQPVPDTLEDALEATVTHLARLL